MRKISAKTIMNRYEKIKNYLKLNDKMEVCFSNIYEDYYFNIYSYIYEEVACKAISVSLLIRVTPKRLKEIEGMLFN